MDKWFQQGSEKYDFEYNPEAWQDMEQLLDRAERRRRALWWWFGLGLVLALTMLFFLFSNNKLKQQGSVNSNDKIEIIDGAHSKKTEAESVLKNNLSDEELEENKDGLSDLKADVTDEDLVKEPIRNTAQNSSVSVFSGNPNQPIKSSNEKFRETNSLDLTIENIVLQPPKDVENTEVEILPKIENTLQEERSEDWAIDVPDFLPTLPFSVVREKEILHIFPLDSLSERPAAKEDDTSQKTRAFLLGLSSASEWNSAGFGDFSQQNWKVGLHTEYRFRDRFGLSLGATWMRMDYDAAAGEYAPKAGFWVNGIAPNATFGRCDMLELPIQLHYHFNGFEKDGFFVSAGLSSYWILEEHYWYNYDNPLPDLVFYWGTEKDERNWFNLGLFSFGYQKRWTPKTSLSVGPYLQVPLTGVGHGFVEIYSLGLQAKVDFWLRPK